MTEPRAPNTAGPLVLRLPGQVLVLTAGELLALLRRDPATWRRALARGKRWRRVQTTARRMGAPPPEETEPRKGVQ